MPRKRSTVFPGKRLFFQNAFFAIEYEMPDERPIDGLSLLPILQNKPWKRDRSIPFASQMQKLSPKASIVHKNHKFLQWFDTEKGDELYSVQDDPSESDNLVARKPELAAELKKELSNWLRSARHSYEKGDYPDYEKQSHFINTNEAR